MVSIDPNQAFDKIQQPFMMTTLGTVGIQGKFFNLVKSIYKKPMLTLYLILKDQMLSLQGQKQDKDFHSYYPNST